MTLAPQALKVAPPRIFVLTLFFLFLPTIHVRAATITVNSACSLADAITSANSDSNTHNSNCTAGSGNDTITLTANITLSAEPTAIASNITIEGANKSISGNNTVRILRINSGDVQINNLTLTKGRATDLTPGPGNDHFGGAIYVDSGSATLTVSKSHFIDNVAPEHSSCAASFGGAITSFGGTVTIEDSVFRGNRATEAAALLIGINDTLILRRSSFTGHGHPVDLPDDCMTPSSHVIRTQGGGSTISNVTVSGNSVAGIEVINGTTTISHSTIVNNENAGGPIGGVYQVNPSPAQFEGKMNLYNNIIANNSPRDCGGEQATSTWLLAHANNLIKDGTCSPAAVYNGDPLLGSLVSPSNAPAYHALRQGSPAIDAGDATQCGNLPLVNGQRVDIRGVARSDGACDIGSYEGFLALPRSGGGGGGDDEEGTLTPDVMTGTVCADCPDLLAQGYRLKAHNGLDSGVQFRRVGAEAIGDRSLLAGFLDAIDVYGWAEQGVGVCFPGAGSLLFLDAAFSPRAQIPLNGYTQEGLTCADIDRPGTLLLLTGAAPTARRDRSLSTAGALSNCMVTTESLVYFRETPDGERLRFVDRWGAQIAGWLPRGVTLTALERTADWFRVDYHGTQGWISAHHVTRHGVCG